MSRVGQHLHPRLAYKRSHYQGDLNSPYAVGIGVLEPSGGYGILGVSCALGVGIGFPTIAKTSDTILNF